MKYSFEVYQNFKNDEEFQVVYIFEEIAFSDRAAVEDFCPNATGIIKAKNHWVVYYDVNL